MVDWNLIIQTVGGATGVAAVLAWFARSIVTTYLNKDLERYKNDLSLKSALEVERLRSALTVESAKQELSFGSLHAKRAEFMADLYSRLLQLEGLMSRLQFQYQHREIREDIDRRFRRDKREEWQLELGIDTLAPDEQARVDELNQSLSEFYEFFRDHRLYFSKEVCDLIDRFTSLASYQAMNYENVALKDREGNLLVNPIVKEAWDSAVEVAPQILPLLESEFRSILGVESHQQNASNEAKTQM